MKRSTYRRKPKRLWLKVLLTCALLLIAGSSAFAYSIYHNTKQTVANKITQPVDSIDTSVGKKKVKDQEPLNVLLLGVDERENDAGRSDAMMVLSLDPKQDSMQLISIPRDTRTEIVGKGTQDKINHAYAFGGVDMSVNTVEKFLDIDLDYYVRLNMEGLTELVGAVDGITVNNEIEFSRKGHRFPLGEIELSKDETLDYVRMRKQDPNGDFGRNERQRKVIQGIIDKGASVGSVGKIDDIVQVLGNNMASNMDFDDMQNLLLNYRNTRKNITTYQMQGSGTKIDGIYYYVIDEEETSKVHDMISNK
ncbi:LCP family protein [Sediminibacillus halophilus]|uniref:Cell envelope-related function transcriptional attenuator common domain-containing protein n=1 Tax=Sediminibacillus halophilus TaxID=482461 RepID=A0A1G9U9W3_9BACI|nr:LCP family protein [Sediminibacillus halophilus]SDM56622.1 cell envelope-related function transcriptional attenuator common domain-containing protein [Sediminibacillus halophilus]